ncbi:MAG: glycosyltransferase family 2 protein [Bacteroidetes bacterium]|nr:glycosyltransferase family 2 protein [Bacteroidota bacterium]
MFSRITEAQPARLFIIADGPRKNVIGEDEKCREVRSIVEDIDWDCDLSVNFAESNLGCRNRVSSGLDWVFNQTESAIILEDDCLPSLSFFRFCDELLEKYWDEPSVMMVSGTNLLRESSSDSSYLFTMHGRVWGWATWKRAWNTYDVDLKSWPKKKLENPFRRLPLHKKEIGGLERTLDDLYDRNPENRKLDTWDFQWDYNRYIHNGLAITPKVNLVTNIGFGDDATHTPDRNHKLANIPIGTLDFPLEHPETIELSVKYEENFYKKVIRKSFGERVRNFFRRAKKFIERL